MPASPDPRGIITLPTHAVRYAANWSAISGQGGQGTRTTVELPLTRVTGTRVTIACACTAANGRFQFEGLGLNPGDGRAAA